LEADGIVCWLAETEERNDARVVDEEEVDWPVIHTCCYLSDLVIVVAVYAHSNDDSASIIVGLNFLDLCYRESVEIMDSYNGAGTGRMPFACDTCRDEWSKWRYRR